MTGTSDNSTADLVRAEMEHGLPELEILEFDTECELSDGPLAAVAWTVVAKPRPDRSFLGVHLSEALTLRGVTLMRRSDDGNVLLRWYIDWLDALNRAGLNAALRPVPDGPQPSLPELLSLIP